MTREEMVELRKRLIVGEPPYERDPMGSLIRKTGSVGLDELRVLSDYGPGAAAIRTLFEAQIMLLDHLLPPLKGDQ